MVICLAVPLWIVERASEQANTRSAINRASESNASQEGAGEEAGKERGNAFSSVTNAFR